MEIPLGPLRAFYLAARHQSFNRAARDLGVTQPAVTQQIRRLERAIGVRLFQREGRRMTPSDVGRLLEPFAERIFHLVDAARDALEGAAGLRTGLFAFGASRTAGSYYAPALLDRFKRRHPNVAVSLAVGNSQTVLAGVLDFTYHAGLIAGHPGDARLVVRPLIRDRLLAVLPTDHRLAGRRTVSVADLSAYPVLLREPGSTTRRIVEDAFARRGARLQPAMELESNEAMKAGVADGVGVAVMARAAVAQDLAAGRLAGRPLRERLTLDFALVCHRDRVLSPVLAAFLRTLPAATRRRARRRDGIA